jgi:hypothetical protein
MNATVGTSLGAMASTRFEQPAARESKIEADPT